MNTYETSATVEAAGEVRIAGVPFNLGAEVRVTLTLKDEAGPSHEAESTARLQALLQALDRGRNTQPLGALNRDESAGRESECHRNERDGHAGLLGSGVSKEG